LLWLRWVCGGKKIRKNKGKIRKRLAVACAGYVGGKKSEKNKKKNKKEACCGCAGSVGKKNPHMYLM
jgi:hypothetical protein